MGTGLHFSLMLVALLTVAMLGVACSGDEKDTSQSTEVAPVDSQPKPGGTLRVALVKAHTSFDPHIVNDNPDIQLTRHAYDNLILLDPDDLSLIPMLAKSWEANDDLTQFTFRMRSGVKFHHGKELTVEDVAYSFEGLLDPDVGSPIAATLDFVSNAWAALGGS